jgi:hypothetical protein
VRAHARAFEFLLRERSGGSPVMREAIAKEIHYFVNELAADLRLLEPYARFSASPGSNKTPLRAGSSNSA